MKSAQEYNQEEITRGLIRQHLMSMLDDEIIILAQSIYPMKRSINVYFARAALLTYIEGLCGREIARAATNILNSEDEVAVLNESTDGA